MPRRKPDLRYHPVNAVLEGAATGAHITARDLPELDKYPALQAQVIATAKNLGRLYEEGDRANARNLAREMAVQFINRLPADVGADYVGEAPDPRALTENIRRNPWD